MHAVGVVLGRAVAEESREDRTVDFYLESARDNGVLVTDRQGWLHGRHL